MATAGAVSVAVELGVSPEGGCLAQRLSEIAASVAPEDMLEPALRAIVTESGAAAGALCFFDSRQDLLRLAAEVGLSDEGCRQLRAVRRGAATGWDIPLHGLVNRRAYLIDSAAQNRYVPPLVEPPGSMRAIVCIPLHSGPSPVGSLILVAVAPRSFGERDIHALEAPLGVLVKMIQATRRRGGEQTSPRAAAPSPAPGKPEGADADRVQLLIASLAATERERSRLATAVEAAAAERAEHARVQATLEARAVEQAAEVRRLTERLASEQARLQAALDTAAAEHTAEVQRLTEGLASEHSRLRAAETAAAEHAAEVQRLTEGFASERARLETALEAAAAERAAEVQRMTERLGPEQARFQAALEAAAAEVERLTTQVASEQARFEAALETAAAERAAEVEHLTEGFASERARLETALETSTAEVERLTAQLASEQARFEAALEAAAAEHAAEVERLTLRLESAVEAETPPPDVKQATPAATVPPRESVVAVLDTGAAWPSAGPGGESVTIVSPDAGAAVRITELAPGCLVANLAAPGALEALAALRAAGSTTRVRGCLAATEHAVSLGAVEAIARPLDADAIQRALGAHASRGARILIVGTDVDFFAALREALGRGGLSVSMAWDAHQVDDLLDMVRPDIALIDLALGSRDVRPIVAKLASLEPVPTVAFVLGPDPAAPHFRAAMTYPIVATRAKPLDQLLAKVSEAKGPIADGRR